MKELLEANTPWSFWQLLDRGITAEDWRVACREARHCLSGLPAAQATGLDDTMAAILGEEQFGPAHWQLSRAKRLYYAVKPFLPLSVRPVLQRLSAHRTKADGLLNWPMEDRYVRYLFESLRQLLVINGRRSMAYSHFWPAGYRFAAVLTHDVESAAGQAFVERIAALEEEHGFRSSFNFVPEKYAVDTHLLARLQERGFEIGIHGLRHGAELFSSLKASRDNIPRVNDYLEKWRASGFRAPLTIRHPEWMQALDVEYDSSFFDTDPFEPIPGGTMSIWPFFLGHFVELPYTLLQDHTLMRTLRETTPRLWLEKASFIRRYCGMALVNAHPDYLRHPPYLEIYRSFLMELQVMDDMWRALPGQVARWWRQRAGKDAPASRLANSPAPQPTATGTVRLAWGDEAATATQGLILELAHEPVSMSGGT